MALTTVSNKQLFVTRTTQGQQIELLPSTEYLLTKFDATRYRSVAVNLTSPQQFVDEDHIAVDDTPRIDVWIIGPDSLTWAKAAEEILEYVQVTTTTVMPEDNTLFTIRNAGVQHTDDHDVIILAEVQPSESLLDVCMSYLRRGGFVDVYGFGDVSLMLPDQKYIRFPSFFTHRPVSNSVRKWLRSQMSAPNEHHAGCLAVRSEPWRTGTSNEDTDQDCHRRSRNTRRRKWLSSECRRHLRYRHSSTVQTLYDTLQSENTIFEVVITTIRLVIYKPSAERLSATRPVQIPDLPPATPLALLREPLRSRNVRQSAPMDHDSHGPSHGNRRQLPDGKYVHRRTRTGCLTCRERRVKVRAND